MCLMYNNLYNIKTTLLKQLVFTSLSLGDEMEDSMISTSEADIMDTPSPRKPIQVELSHLVVWQVSNV